MRLRTLTSIAVVLLSLLLAPAAHAGKTSIDFQFDEERGQPTTVATFLNFVASPGEQNDLTVSYDGKGHWLFHDTGAPIDASNCVQVDEHTADCAAGDGPTYEESDGEIFLGLHGVMIETGDGDDHVSTGPLSSKAQSYVRGGRGNDTMTVTTTTPYFGPFVYGQAGDDVLTGSASGDDLYGGDGDDTLVGGEGGDVLVGARGADDLSGGDGNDTLYDRSPAAEVDRYDGGAGSDGVDFQFRPSAVRVDLAARTTSDGDVLDSIENAYGGDGADTLLGDAGPNMLDGDAGDDDVRGRGGDDSVGGSAGIDALRGGAGDDLLDSEDSFEVARSAPAAHREHVRCGPGLDRTVERDGGDRTGRDCERARLSGVALYIDPPELVTAPLTLGAHRLSGAAIMCSSEALKKGCHGTITALVRRGKRMVTIGAGTVGAGPGLRAAVPIRLRRDAPAYLQRPGPHAIVLRVRLAVRTTDSEVGPHDAIVRHSLTVSALR
jgi:Ca2+-binding RTX toxin-like protein